MIAVTGTAAQAAPADTEPPEPQTTTVTYQMPPKKMNLRASFSTADAAKRQDPPLGGCNWHDISGTVVASYVNGRIVGTNSTWSAKAFCTTTAPGQAMAGIVIDSTLWYLGRNVAPGRPFACQDCNLGNSTGDYAMPGGSGSYWVSGIFAFFLPDGWIWTGLPDGCSLIDAHILECGSISDTVYVPPTW
jgi:hypothetical protein